MRELFYVLATLLLIANLVACVCGGVSAGFMYSGCWRETRLVYVLPGHALGCWLNETVPEKN